jgi:hypothetical protein
MQLIALNASDEKTSVLYAFFSFHIFAATYAETTKGDNDHECCR